MSANWPSVSYQDWTQTCDTLHAHTQVLGKLAVKLAPPEPQLQHAALRLTARGWETTPLPAPDGSGSLVAALDLRTHEAVAEHSDGRAARIPLTPDRPVGAVTRDLLAAIADLAGPVRIDPTPQEVPWTVPLDQDEEHASYDPDQVAGYFAAATQAALVLAAYRAPYRGRSTPVNAWWGSFDLAVSLFSGERPRRHRKTSSCATRWTPRRWRSAGGQVTRATRRPPSTPTPTPPRPATARPTCRSRAPTGTPSSASISCPGTRSGPRQIRTRSHSTSPAPRSATPARSANGTPG